jgi:hypothetical protein
MLRRMALSPNYHKVLRINLKIPRSVVLKEYPMGEWLSVNYYATK